MTGVGGGPGLGAIPLGEDRCRFLVYAPFARHVEVRILAPGERRVPLSRDGRGYHGGVAEDAPPGSLYFYVLDGEKQRPDPASRFQPRGVHGPSQVTDLALYPRDCPGWNGLPLEEYLLYEIHVGTFTPEGTFDAAALRLPELAELGITAVEIMPVAQFPGRRNWGYDGVYPFAVQESYGGPAGLARLVDACHRHGMAVVLDVVYNHLGPEGNYLGEFGPYFTDRYRTPWGQAINFDGPHSDEVRRYFLENALHWLEGFRVDALRLDAIHGITDLSAYEFLAELADAVGALRARTGRKAWLIPESDRNDARVVLPRERGGYGHDAQWNDDFHHVLRVLLTGERTGYYEDFGTVEQMGKAFSEGFVYSGQYSPYRKRRHGNSSREIPVDRLVVFSQNHDQVGNRLRGDRLGATVPFEGVKLAAAVVLLSPGIPLLFMGEEYGETAPFLYFVEHSDPELIDAVRRGRREEFAAFRWEGEIPDPQAEETFLRSKLTPALRHGGNHRILREFYRELIRLRKTHPALSRRERGSLEVRAMEADRTLLVRRWDGGQEAVALFHFGSEPRPVRLSLPGGSWRTALDSSDPRWGGGGSAVPDPLPGDGEIGIVLPPYSAALYVGTRPGTGIPGGSG